MTDANIIPKGPPRLGPAPKRMAPSHRTVIETNTGDYEILVVSGQTAAKWMAPRLAILILVTAGILFVAEATGIKILNGAALIFFPWYWVKTIFAGEKKFGVPISNVRIKPVVRS